MNKRKVGKNKENVARDYLIEQGYHIIETNYFTKFGEIDLIAVDDDTICFIEVKYRANKDFGLGVEAVDKRKQNKIVSVAKYYVASKNMNINYKYRFDVVSIDKENITLYKGAFS